MFLHASHSHSRRTPTGGGELHVLTISLLSARKFDASLQSDEGRFIACSNSIQGVIK